VYVGHHWRRFHQRFSVDISDPFLPPLRPLSGAKEEQAGKNRDRFRSELFQNSPDPRWPTIRQQEVESTHLGINNTEPICLRLATRADDSSEDG